MGFHRSLEKSRGGGERGDKKLLWCQARGDANNNNGINRGGRRWRETKTSIRQCQRYFHWPPRYAILAYNIPRSISWTDYLGLSFEHSIRRCRFYWPSEAAVWGSASLFSRNTEEQVILRAYQRGEGGVGVKTAFPCSYSETWSPHWYLVCE